MLKLVDLSKLSKIPTENLWIIIFPAVFFVVAFNYYRYKHPAQQEFSNDFTLKEGNPSLNFKNSYFENADASQEVLADVPVSQKNIK
jgi:hypothetical protein